MEDTIRTALGLYGLSRPVATLIRHNENLACHVVDEGREYLLRIHKAAEGFDLTALLGQTGREARLSRELDALRQLGANGLPVQQPALSKRGLPYEVLPDGSPVSLLNWIPGEALGERYGKHLKALGQMIARMHGAAEGLTGGIAYDEGLVSRLVLEVDKAVELGHIPSPEGSTCQAALDLIRRVMAAGGQDAGGTGLIHADLNPGNIILGPKGLAPIDFSLSGTGCLAQDLGMALTGIPSLSDRRAVIAAYEKERGTKLLPHHLDAFFCLSILLFICCQHHRYYREAWFAERLRHWTSSYFEAFMEGRIFSV